MRVLRKIMALTLALTLVLSMGAMTAMAANGRGIVERSRGLGRSGEALGISLDKATLSLVGAGASGKLTITLPGGVSGVEWISSDKTVATVEGDDTGAVVTAENKNGETTITASASGATSATCEVTVTGASTDFVAVTDIKMTSATTVTAGTDLTLAATVVPTTATSKNIVWSLKSGADASVVDGVLKTTKAGDVVVIATIANGATASTPYTKEFDIKVNPVKSSTKELFDFRIKDSNSVPDSNNHTIAVEVPYNTNVTKLIPTFKISDKATVSPASGVAQDFTEPVTYTVTAEDGSTQEYVVTVTKGTKPTATLFEIKVTTGPTKTVYTAGEKFDATGMVVTAIYSDGEKAPVTGYTVKPNTALATTNKVITITYTEGGVTKTTTQSITVNPKNNDGGSSGGGTPPSSNNANSSETTDKVKDTIDAIKDPAKEMPKEAVKTTTAGGASITTIPIALSSGSATLGTDIFNTIGGATASVGLKLTVSNGMGGGSMEVIIPGGFGKITEPGRISYPMDYSATAEHSSTMTNAVKGDNAVSMTAKVGGNFTLPVTATVTVPTKLANGSKVNIYKYDPITNKLIVIGKAVVKDGKLTFATKMMGEMLFTTGSI